MSIIKFAKKHIFFIALSALFFISSMVLFQWFTFSINPDATSYFSIAREYASGNIADAINGYWGPLFSLLLVPAVWFQIDLIFAAKFLLTAICLAILATVYSFLRAKNV